RSKSPFGRIVPRAPIEAPRPTGSSAAMWSTAAIFGAPVIEPPGNVAARISARPASSRSVPSTVLTRWSTPASSCGTQSSGQRRERRREPGRIAFEPGREVLDEVDLVHVPALDRRPHGFDRVRVAAVLPAPLPRADRVVAGGRGRSVGGADLAGHERQPARLG